MQTLCKKILTCFLFCGFFFEKQGVADYHYMIRLTSEAKVLTGVNVSDGLIVSCDNSGVNAYDAVFFGPNGKKMSLKATVVKKDTITGLVLLKYNKPSFITHKVQDAVIQDPVISFCDLKGWAESNIIYQYNGLKISKNLDLLGGHGFDYSGYIMTQNETVVGIVFYNERHVLYWVDSSFIKNFIENSL